METTIYKLNYFDGYAFDMTAYFETKEEAESEAKYFEEIGYGTDIETITVKSPIELIKLLEKK